MYAVLLLEIFTKSQFFIELSTLVPTALVLKVTAHLFDFILKLQMQNNENLNR